MNREKFLELVRSEAIDRQIAEAIDPDSALLLDAGLSPPAQMTQSDANLFFGSVRSFSVQLSKSLEEILERDKQREKDGLPRKIKVGRIIRPSKNGKGKARVVPATIEEKLVHDRLKPPKEEGNTGGAGDGQEGEILGEQPIDQDAAGEGGAGEGEGGEHGMETDFYEIGRQLTENLELPNLQDKGKKKSLVRYTYDLTDTHRGAGQLLDKKATLRKIVETNTALGRIVPDKPVNTQELLVGPKDKVFRVLSREKEYEAQAMVFFLRDYSGSMWGKATDVVVKQHVLIYSWLLFQYANRVETRFILHDTEAKEVPDFYTYYNSQVAGGTKVKSAYELINQIIEGESLYRDYNIYVFHGTDGDDWDKDGSQTVPVIRQTIQYANRIGVSVVTPFAGKDTVMSAYLDDSGLLNLSDLLRLDNIPEDSPEERMIEGIKRLISEKSAAAEAA